MVTAEIAATMPVIVAVLTIALTALGAVTDQLRCVDAARTGARLLARGEQAGRVRSEVERQAPDGAAVALRVGASEVEVVVAGDVPALLGLLGVRRAPRATATALREGVP